MKIERLNENQLKFTLSSEDLRVRGLLLSELSPNSFKTKELYDELLEQAIEEFGFKDFTDIIIEATPTNSGSLVLVVTRNSAIPNSNFSVGTFSDSPIEKNAGFLPLPDFLEYLNKNREGNVYKRPSFSSSDTKKIYVFDSLENVIEATTHLKNISFQESTVYKNIETNKYYLVLVKENSVTDDFKKSCILLSDYADVLSTNYATLSMLEEHCKKLISKDAVKVLSDL